MTNPREFLPEGEWLTIAEVSSIPRFKMLKPATLRYLLRQNDAPFGVKIGGVWYWQPSEIDRWMAARMANGIQHPHHGQCSADKKSGRPRREVR